MGGFWDALLAFLGAAIGSGLVFWATRSQTKVEQVAREREEWGRRFTSALEAINSTDRASRATGRALLVELLSSPLATDDDRRAAQAVLDAAATHDQANLHLLVPPGSNLNDLNLVRDTGGSGDTGAEPSAQAAVSSKQTIVVTDDQVESAQALIRISGGPDKVDPLIRRIVEAKPRTEAEKDRGAS